MNFRIIPKTSRKLLACNGFSYSTEGLSLAKGTIPEKTVRNVWEEEQYLMLFCVDHIVMRQERWGLMERLKMRNELMKLGGPIEIFIWQVNHSTDM